MTASLSSFCFTWLWKPFSELPDMLSDLTQNKISTTTLPVVTSMLTRKEVQKNTHAPKPIKQKNYFHFDKLQKGCTNTLCMSCWGSAMN